MPLWLSVTIVLATFYAMAAVVGGPFLKSLDIIAARMRLPSSVAGATLLAFGTSAPEIATAFVALFAEGMHPAMGVGNIVGSALFQLLVVVGFAAAVRASTLDWRPVLRDSIFYALSVGLLALFVSDDRLTALEASVLVGTYGVYLAVMVYWARNVDEGEPAEVAPEDAGPPMPKTQLRRLLGVLTWPIDRIVGLLPDPERRPSWTIPVFAISLALVAVACYWLVAAAEALAHSLSVPPAIIALTILAGGSSIPELISSATVSRQGRGDMAIANAVGSNIFDILVSLGLPVLIYCLMNGDLVGLGGATVTSSILLLFATLLMVFGLLVARRFRVSRAFGLALVLAYALYVLAAYLGWLG